MKKVLALMCVLVFISGISVTPSQGEPGFSGVVTQIKGDKVTVKDDSGKLRTITTSSTGFKVGDHVTVRGTSIQSRSIPIDPWAKTQSQSIPADP